ncbi:PfkB family carbohydrate kinase [Palleronia sp. LCG004]|uniref:PfkB family carbohydrate kinase n=1 Tax=Palleronia sp. LCG004 TaxID=3079304 RepID=UPI0029423EA5|nr:PfkB family carbohydrate kinase [Palleronia sp. LCG004]WOI58137.1 PfkB family carbohydrate kinase [Palleronia sp. LCG004]
MPTAKTLVAGFGALSVDEIVHVDAPLSAGKGRVLRRTRAFGGNVATALVAVARLGGEASYIGWLPEDPDDPAIRDLECSGVRTDRAPRDANSRPIRSLISVGSDGERFIAFDDDVPLGTALDTLDDTLSQAGALMIDGYAIESLAAVERARVRSVPVVADIEWVRGPASDRLIALSDHLVLPLGFARAHTGRDDPSEILDALWSSDRAAIVLTDGERGVYYRAGPPSTAGHQSAFEVPVVDTTGAGDCFHGAYAQALVSGADLAERVAFAAAAAALSVTGPGGRDALPGPRQVEDMLSHGPHQANPNKNFRFSKF